MYARNSKTKNKKKEISWVKWEKQFTFSFPEIEGNKIRVLKFPLPFFDVTKMYDWQKKSYGIQIESKELKSLAAIFFPLYHRRYNPGISFSNHWLKSGEKKIINIHNSRIRKPCSLFLFFFFSASLDFSLHFTSFFFSSLENKNSEKRDNHITNFHKCQTNF